MKRRPSVSEPSGLITTGAANPALVSPDLSEDERVFDTRIHETEVHVPVLVLDARDTLVDGLRLDDCLDLPIRLKGDEAYSLPENWSPIHGLLQQVIDVEHSNNPNWRDYYTYLTVEYSDGLAAGQQQRHGGAHTDGFQGVRVPERTKTSRSYVAVTNGGTYFYPQPFVAGLDAAVFNVFEGFDAQIRRDEHGDPIRGVAQEKAFYFFNAYAVHESGETARDGSRLFIRLTWEQKKFDRSINTRNGMLDYNWEPVHYDVRTDLRTPSMDDIEAARQVKVG